jgi:hypothetical protein
VQKLYRIQFYKFAIFIVLFTSIAFGKPSSERDLFYAKIQNSCPLINKTKDKCEPQGAIQFSAFQSLQVSCETFRQGFKCDELESNLLERAKDIKNLKEQTSERNSIKEKIQGCSADRICAEKSQILSCGAGVLDGLVDTLMAIPNLAIALVKLDSEIFNTPVGAIIEEIKKEMGDKWNCYSPQARLQMICYIAASTIAPGGAVKAISQPLKLKFPEIAGLKALNKSNTTSSPPATAAAKVAVAVTPDIAANPQIAIWSLRRSDPEQSLKLQSEFAEKLKNEKIVSREPVGIGAFDAEIVTLKDGTKGIWKPDKVDKEIGDMLIYRSGLARAETAAYVVDQKLGLDRVPVTVPRKLDGEKGSLQLLVKDLDKAKFYSDPVQFGFFDELVSNADRHGGNIISHQGHAVAIDHGLAFTKVVKARPFQDSMNLQLKKLDAAKTPTEREIAISEFKTLLPPKHVVEKLRTITDEEWKADLSEYINKRAQVDHFLKKKNDILNIIDKAEKKAGSDIYPDGNYSPLIRKNDR